MRITRQRSELLLELFSIPLFRSRLCDGHIICDTRYQLLSRSFPDTRFENLEDEIPCISTKRQMSDVAQVNYAVRYFDRSFLYRTPQSRLKMCEEISPQLAIHSEPIAWFYNPHEPHTFHFLDTRRSCSR